MNMSKRARPGTRLNEVAAAVLEATKRHGRGVRLAEITIVHSELFPYLNAGLVSRALKRLTYLGVLTKLGGQDLRTHWMHSQHPVPSHDEDDQFAAGVEVVRTLCAKLKRAVSTQEVHRAMLAAGSDLTSDQVRTRLETAARVSARKEERSSPGWGIATLERLVRIDSGGKSRVHWAPRGEDLTPPLFDSDTDALRHALRIACEVAGRPLSRDELRAWAEGSTAVDASTREAARIVLQDKLGYRLQRFLRARSGAQGGQVVRTSLTSRRAYPPRYSWENPSSAAAAACELEDLALLLRPHSEVEGIRALEVEAESTGSTVLLAIAAQRAEVLAASIRDRIPNGVDPRAWVEEGFRNALDARDVVQEWRTKRAPAANGESLGEFNGFAAVCLNGRVVEADRSIINSPGVDLASLHSLATEVLALAESSARHWEALLMKVRRTTGPRMSVP
jgi:hypothetical protein